MEGIDRETRPAGREMRVLVFGDNADEIELAALDEVRGFFGDDVRLEVICDYKVFRVLPGEAVSTAANGKKYRAGVTVRTIEAGE